MGSEVHRVAWLNLIALNPSLCGGRSIWLLENFLHGALVAETSLRLSPSDDDWQRVFAFEREFSDTSTRGPYRNFLCRHATDVSDAFDRFFCVVESLEPTSARADDPYYTGATIGGYVRLVSGRPGMYFSPISPDGLYALLNGFVWRRDTLGLPPEDLPAYREFEMGYLREASLEPHKSWNLAASYLNHCVDEVLLRLNKALDS